MLINQEKLPDASGRIVVAQEATAVPRRAAGDPEGWRNIGESMMSIFLTLYGDLREIYRLDVMRITAALSFVPCWIYACKQGVR
jgi:hypothetical protein